MDSVYINTHIYVLFTCLSLGSFCKVQGLSCLCIQGLLLLMLVGKCGISDIEAGRKCGISGIEAGSAFWKELFYTLDYFPSKMEDMLINNLNN